MLIMSFILIIIFIIMSYVGILLLTRIKVSSLEEKRFLSSDRKKMRDEYLESQFFLIKNMHHINQKKRVVNFYIGRHDKPFYMENSYSEVVLHDDHVKVELTGCYKSYMKINYSLLLEHIPCDILKEISIRKQKMGIHRYRKNYTRLITELGESHDYIVQEKEELNSQLFVGAAVESEHKDIFGIPKVYHVRLFESSDCLDRFNSKIGCSPYGCRCRV